MEIVNVSGDVHVVGWDRAEVQVNADLGAGVERLEFHREGRRTVVKVILPSGKSSSGSSDLLVRVPQGSAVSINTVSAEQTVEGVRGAQRLQAVSGGIRTEIWGAEFEAKTVSGEIEVVGHGGDGPMRVTSVSGDVRLLDIGPELDLSTVTGDMDVKMSDLTRVRIKTTNGDLELIGQADRERAHRRRSDQRRSQISSAGPRERRVRHRDVQRRHRQLLRTETEADAASSLQATNCDSAKAKATARCASRR